MNPKFRVLIGFVFLIGFRTIVNGQVSSTLPQYDFEMLELPNGVEGNHVNAIAQDSLGFMWFGTKHGLLRYDGYKYKTFSNVKNDPTSIASNDVHNIHVSQDGHFLWLTMGQGKVGQFDLQTERFTHFQMTDKTGIPQRPIVIEMVPDHQDNLWMASNYGLYYFDTKKKEFTSYFHDPSDDHSLTYNVCRALLIDSKGVLWVGTGSYNDVGIDGASHKGIENGGLNRFRPETQDFVRYKNDPSEKNSLINDVVTEITEDRKGNFWIGTKGYGIQQFDRDRAIFVDMNQGRNQQSSIEVPYTNDSNERVISYIFEDKAGKLWFSLTFDGILSYDPNTKQNLSYLPDSDDPDSFLEPLTTRIYQSRDNTIWMCTSNSLARLYKLKLQQYRQVKLDHGHEIKVNNFTETSEGKIIFATEFAQNLFSLDPSTQAITALNEDNKWKQEVFKKGKKIYAPRFQKEDFRPLWKVRADDKNQIWFNIFQRNETFCLDINERKVKIYLPENDDPDLVFTDWVTEVFSDRDDDVWTTTKAGLIKKYDSKENQFSHWFFGHNEDDVNRSYYSILSQSTNGKLIMAYTPDVNGQLALQTFDPATEKFNKIPLIYEPGASALIYRLLSNIMEDADGYVWICLDSGLLKIDPKTGKTQIFEANYFGLNKINRIVLDDLNRIWIFSDRLVLFDLSDLSQVNFEMPKAKIGRRKFTKYFETGSFKDSKGNIYFGTPDGFASFNPAVLADTISQSYATEISDFELLFQKELGIEEVNAPRFTIDEEISLNHHQNNFTFRFSTLNYSKKGTIRYEYMLDGYDDHWRPAGNSPEATYIKVPSGHYSFKVRSSEDGISWGPIKTASLTIIPPFWASWWAYLLYLVLLIGLSYWFYTFQLEKKLRHSEANRLKELDAVKTKLYTNITHEFRTPLTVITGMASQMKEDPKQWFTQGISMIENNAARLLALVNQMLDLSKLESGKTSLTLKQGDIVNFLRYIVESFHSYARSKEIAIHFYSEEEVIIMDFDGEKIQQVMSNLITNAIKFTPKQGNIYITSSVIKIDNPNDLKVKNQNLQIQVRDTGEGITDDDIPFVFDRFFQADYSTSRSDDGTGIGLALVKELMYLMDGDISVKSRIGQETVFTLNLPINQHAGIPSQAKLILSQDAAQKMVPDIKQVSSNLPVSEEVVVGRPTLLLIEDNLDVVAYVAICLDGIYNLKIGNNGQEGIDIAIESVPDIIITDVMMPIKDGFQVCKELKNNVLTSHIPIIMLTAKVDMESKIEGLETGADAYLMKPFQKKELLVRLKNLLKIRKKLQLHYQSYIKNDNTRVLKLGVNEIKGIENEFIENVRDLILNNLENNDFGVEELCRGMGMSRSQLHRKLSAVVGQSPNKFINSIRLNTAGRLLESSDVNVSDVAYQVGFSDPSYFTRSFKKEFGMTPMEWKQKFN
ncbi:hybrid sensor histidine kinase/response regulator transcription factor [Portibacter lacus]|uniref:histidine kinase n=1 Tax=Portibacter lacus TaxID=1099794 RepID=A0AA37SQL0_9BACT|nr:hybrid sensor histidine kinase/response regulator transcription factor [Portibacter lacus]GLR17619.1 hybrid sensor histidine kinase/response regulator [Portibacter lacus]